MPVTYDPEYGETYDECHACGESHKGADEANALIDDVNELCLQVAMLVATVMAKHRVPMPTDTFETNRQAITEYSAIAEAYGEAWSHPARECDPTEYDHIKEISSPEAMGRI